MGEVGMAVQKRIQTRVVGIIRYMLQGCSMYLIIPITIVRILCTAIPASPINCFLCLLLLLFLLPLGKHMHCLWATPILGSISNPSMFTPG